MPPSINEPILGWGKTVIFGGRMDLTKRSARLFFTLALR